MSLGLSLTIFALVLALGGTTLRADWRELPTADRAFGFALALLFALALGATAGWSSLEHLEVSYLFEAIKPNSLGELVFGRQASEQMHQPLFPMVLSGWARLLWPTLVGAPGGAAAPLTDGGTAWLRMPSVLFAAFGLLLIWSSVRVRHGRQAAWLAGAVVALNPLVLWYGRDVSPYALLFFLGTVAVVSVWQSFAAPSTARGARIRAGLALAAAFYTHFHGAWLAVLVGLWLWPERPPPGAAPTRRLARFRPLLEVTATTALLCLPAISLLLEKLVTSVQGLSEDQPMMRYSHALDEALPEALRVLFGGDSTAWVLVAALAGWGGTRGRGPVRRLLVVAAVVAVVAEVHITWQLSAAKGIVYIDVRHYIYLVPIWVEALLAVLGSRWGRAAWLAPLVAATTSLPIALGQIPKPAAAEAVTWVREQADSPEHGIAYLPAPWYSGIIEVYLTGPCAGLVHGRSFEGWWSLESCALSERPADGSVYGFPFGADRLWTSRLRRGLRWIWLIDFRDHRFGLPVAPSVAQEAMACWPSLTAAIVQTRHFGPWVTVSKVDVERLRDGAPPPQSATPPVRTIRAHDAWPIRCSSP
ncbi:MAG: glycosyltransferase family 39 protein [Myxococcales bacterium]|nr:glycosyltransferase family 39 protein [Myxococcales bacterium]